jgi:hypothetical protein
MLAVVCIGPEQVLASQPATCCSCVVCKHQAAAQLSQLSPPCWGTCAERALMPCSFCRSESRVSSCQEVRSRESRSHVRSSRTLASCCWMRRPLPWMHSRRRYGVISDTLPCCLSPTLTQVSGTTWCQALLGFRGSGVPHPCMHGWVLHEMHVCLGTMKVACCHVRCLPPSVLLLPCHCA